jgi:hypothetical protein
MDCDSGSGGSGGYLGSCCPAEGSEYILEYDFTVYGRQYTGQFGPRSWIGTAFAGLSISFWEFIDNPPCDNGIPPQSLDFRLEAYCVQGNYNLHVETNCWPNFCEALGLDFDISVTGCPGNPTIYATVKPGHPCLSGTFVLRPASGAGGGGGNNGGGGNPGGGGGGNGLQWCCPPNISQYAIDYSFTMNDNEYYGTISSAWLSSQYNATASHISPECGYLYFEFHLECNDLYLSAVLKVICFRSLLSMLTYPGDLDVVVSNCPGLPTFIFTIKPGRDLSGGFTVRPLL